MRSKSCDKCSGKGEIRVEVIDPKCFGYSSSGDYKEPSYIEEDQQCDVCNGTGQVPAPRVITTTQTITRCYLTEQDTEFTEGMFIEDFDQMQMIYDDYGPQKIIEIEESEE